jgi:hypothetical protein
MESLTFSAALALHCNDRSATIPANDGGSFRVFCAPDKTIGKSQ